jgi:hypothetical protein
MFIYLERFYASQKLIDLEIQELEPIRPAGGYGRVLNCQINLPSLSFRQAGQNVNPVE